VGGGIVARLVGTKRVDKKIFCIIIYKKTKKEV
jgi:hypothetical protein